MDRAYIYRAYILTDMEKAQTRTLPCIDLVPDLDIEIILCPRSVYSTTTNHVAPTVHQNHTNTHTPATPNRSRINNKTTEHSCFNYNTTCTNFSSRRAGNKGFLKTPALWEKCRLLQWLERKRSQRVSMESYTYMTRARRRCCCQNPSAQLAPGLLATMLVLLTERPVSLRAH